MNRAIKVCLSSAIIAYIVKFIVDLTMYICFKNELYAEYNDFWLLFVPQIAASVMMIVFYCLFFSRQFYGMFFMISTIALVLSNLVYVVLIYFDRMIGFTYYFALVAAINFLNSLYIKCNIIPTRKPGYIEYIPLLFELIPFVSMVLSLYAIFCSFPTLEVTNVYRTWDYYDVITGIKLNVISEGILVFSYFLCAINKAEIIRDNMFEEFE